MKQRQKLRCAAFILAALACALAPASVWADGGIVRVRETQGPFVVTVFSPAQVSVGAPTDLTIMVQKSDTGDVMMDATVDVTLTAPDGTKIHSGDPFCSALGVSALPAAGAGDSSAVFRATRASASNRLLYGLPVVLHAPGIWRVHASVRSGAESAVASCSLPVDIASPRFANLWFCLALPPCIIGLFALNQWLRKQSAAALLKSA